MYIPKNRNKDKLNFTFMWKRGTLNPATFMEH